MRSLAVIFFLAVALANSARAQFTIVIDSTSPILPTVIGLNFNPTALGSPYPYRVLPQGARPPLTGVQCYSLNANSNLPINMQGDIPSADNSSRLPIDPGCYKSFPQFFKPLESAVGNDDTYVLQVCNTGTTASRFRVTIAFNPPGGDFNINQFVYRVLSSGISGTRPLPDSWENVTNANPSKTMFLSVTGASGRLPAASAAPNNCTTLTVQLRLRLDGGESFLNAFSPLSSAVTFTVSTP